MSRASVLAMGRRRAEEGMVDTCTITRVTGTTTHPDLGSVVETTTQVYTGRCEVQEPTGGGARAVDAAEAYTLMVGFVLKIPATETGIEVGDKVVIGSSLNCPDLVGRTFRVHGLHHKSHATAQRLGVEEAT